MITQRPFQSFALKFCRSDRSARQLKSMILMLGAIFLLSSAAFAQGLATCSDFPGVLIPDGTNNRSVPDAFTSVAASGVATFAFGGIAGHSYTVEVAEPMAKSNIGFGNFSTVLRAGSDGLSGGQCTAPLFTTGVVDTTGSDPVGNNGNFVRKSFIATTTFADSTDAYFIIVTNTDASNAHYLSVRVIDTTLYNPRWSTNQGYLTVYGFLNTTNQTIHGTLKANITFGGSGSVTYSLNGGAGVAPGAQLLVALGPGLTINIPAGEGGTATLAYDGPPGGLTVDAYFANSVSLVPAVFAPRDSQH